MPAIALAAYLLLAPAPCQPGIACAIEHVESRGNTWAVSSVGARGLWQVMPGVARVPRWLLHVPAVGRSEGQRVLGRWLARCGRRARRQGQSDGQSHGQKQIVSMRCALRAYACGNAGLRGRCEGYAAAVMAAGGGE
jgi:hypothetical protein